MLNKNILHSILTDKKNNSFRSFVILLFYRLMHDTYSDINFLTYRLKENKIMYVCMYVYMPFLAISS